MLRRLRWSLPATTRFVRLNFSFCLFHTLVFAACIEDGRPNVLSIVFVFAYLCRVFAVIRPNTADVGDSIRRVHLMMTMTICFTEGTETKDWRVASSVPTLKPTKHRAEYRILPLPSSSSCLSSSCLQTSTFEWNQLSNLKTLAIKGLTLVSSVLSFCSATTGSCIHTVH